MRRTIGGYLREQLLLRGETADDFAKRIGLNSSGLYQLIREQKTNPTLETLQRIAGGLGMSPGELLIAVEGRAPDGGDVEPDLAVVTANWRHLDIGRRDAIRLLASGLGNTPTHGAGNRTGRLVTQNPRRRGSTDQGRGNARIPRLLSMVTQMQRAFVTAHSAPAPCAA